MSSTRDLRSSVKALVGTPMRTRISSGLTFAGSLSLQQLRNMLHPKSLMRKLFLWSLDAKLEPTSNPTTW